MFTVGQRWISDAESDLGLGIVQEVDFRQVTIHFPAADEVRLYAKQQAPLSRIKFAVGDLVELEDGSKITVHEVEEKNDVIFYGDGNNIIPEIFLSPNLQLSQAKDRLLAGQADNAKSYDLRLRTLQMKNKLESRAGYGLFGSRTNLLSHQLYIANEVTKRELPRVLLADEVGLGKTIEAGMIIHSLLLNEKIGRVLILLPEALVHQWLIEMVRRFNLRFSILDENRCIALEQQEDGANPFLQQQLVLCPISDIAENDMRRQQALEAGWDMVVVDEAHHLKWTPQSHDNRYGLVESLSHETPGLLLLTATPEQLGMEGHFARLRLLDSDRFHSFETFMEEQQHFKPVADAANSLLSNTQLSESEVDVLAKLLPEHSITSTPSEDEKSAWIKELIDQHGTGRVLFRNTRNGVTGFPSRLVNKYELTNPFTEAVETQAESELESRLYPERSIGEWSEVDSRIDWIEGFLKQHKAEKTLLICHNKKTVLEIEQALWDKSGRQCAVFHEDMDIIERDRAAAYFAQDESGAQILLCSEIGSEGRNFQFARHLILFDLPLNCDLIEQRIGRLDRIGQKHDVQIHLPYLADSPQASLIEILDKGMDVFSHPNPLAQTLFNHHYSKINSVLSGDEDLEKLLAELEPLRKEQAEALEKGRDKLLEIQSCDPIKSEKLMNAVSQIDELDQAVLPSFLEEVCDVYGLVQRDHSEGCYTLHPGDHMLVESFPHLPEDGLTYTTRRHIGVARDDVQFFTWEHPLVRDALDLILTEEHGNSSVCYLENHSFNTGEFYVQAQFALETQAPKSLQLKKYFKNPGLHICIMPNSKIILTEPELEDFPQSVDKHTSSGLVKRIEDDLKRRVAITEKATDRCRPGEVASAKELVEKQMDVEIGRLVALQAKNPNIQDAEINMLKDKKALLLSEVEKVSYKLDSIRVVFCG